MTNLPWLKDMQLKHLGLSCLLIATALPALSDSPPRRSEREAVRAFYLQQTGNERAVGQEETQPLPRQVDVQRGPVYAMPETSGYSAPPDANAEQRRRSGRMSPEERRALRRQIDEVGHDIYTQKR